MLASSGPGVLGVKKAGFGNSEKKLTTSLALFRFASVLLSRKFKKVILSSHPHSTQISSSKSQEYGTLEVSHLAILLEMAIAKPQIRTSDAALARKHRIAMRNRQRSTSTISTSSSQDETADEERNTKRPRVALEVPPVVVPSSDAATKSSREVILESIRKKKPHITGIKKQSRYDPGVAMTKEELKAWRKEARRVRNRESAAASRQKNREAIDKLETEVKAVQTKYDAALQYILDLEEKLRRSGSSSLSFYPTNVLRRDIEDVRKVSPTVSPTPSDNEARRPWPIEGQNDLKDTPYQPFTGYHQHQPSTLNSQKHIIDNTIIRPIACV